MKRDLVVVLLAATVTFIVWAWAPWRVRRSHAVVDPAVVAAADVVDISPRPMEGRVAAVVAAQPPPTATETHAAAPSDSDAARDSHPELSEHVRAYLEERGESVEDFLVQQEAIKRAGAAQRSSLWFVVGGALTREGDGKYPTPDALYLRIAEQREAEGDPTPDERARAVEVLGVFLEDMRRLGRSHRDLAQQSGLPDDSSLRSQAARWEHEITVLEQLQPQAESYLRDAEAQLEIILGAARRGGYLDFLLDWP